MRPLFSIFFLFIFFWVHSQELPPLEKFTPSDYNADNQNWMISQASNKFIYVANNKGLIEYNGAVWNFYPSPNNSVLRAVNVIGDKIYTGCYEELGYWERNKFGTLDYTSLVDKLIDDSLKGNQVWNIVNYKEWVLFQTAHGIYFYNSVSGAFKSIASKNIIYKVFTVGNRVYYHVDKEGIYIVVNGEPELIVDDSIVLKDRVINMFEHQGDLLVLTRNSGFFKFSNDEIQPWSIPVNDKLKSLNIFKGIVLSDNSFMLGTISNGVYHINTDGTFDYNINQQKGLANNTVLSLFEDIDKNVWTGLDNGINCINAASFIKTNIDYKGVLGTVYTTAVYKDQLYIGTNQGLFYRPYKFDKDEFIFVEGSSGQVWSLYNDNDENLLCGHHLGTFEIKNGIARNISPILGAWDFRKIPNHDDLLLQGNYDGLHILEKIGKNWTYKNKILGFSNSSRFFEIDENYKVWVNHEYKGVFSFSLDASFTKATNIKSHSELDLGQTSGLILYNNAIYYNSSNGIFKYDKAKKRFSKDSILNQLLDSTDYISGKMSVDKDGKLWMFSKKNISYISNDHLSNTKQITNISMPLSLRKGVQGFENINKVKDNNYFLGTNNGYLRLDLSKNKKLNDHNIYLNEITVIDRDDNSVRLDINEAKEFNHNYGVLQFNYSVPNFDKYTEVRFQYKLDGLNDRWSKWSTNSNIQFENLSFGGYQLIVRSKIGNKLSANRIIYNFEIARPWYISNLALALYIIFLLFLSFLVHKAYKYYFKRILAHEQVKSEKTIIQVQNEKLNQEIESKNRELAISTMSIIKKNEVLGKIKKEIKNNLKKEDVQSAIALIDENINNKKDWKFFKQAFNNADKDFLNKIKIAHPELTPNDLKFCAYLRLNLSSKEIAPLLNISTKSVETKRYRLRKRLQLDHDDSLVNYILKF